MSASRFHGDVSARHARTMGIFNWFRSRSKAVGDERVRFYDIAAQRVIEVPASQIGPGYVQARIQGIDGVVWIRAADVEEGPVRHPPFDEDIRAYIRKIHEAFAEHRDLSFEQWENGFRQDANPEREIAASLYAAEVYRLFTDNEPDATRRHDVYRLLVGCMTAPREEVFRVAPCSVLSRDEAERVITRFFEGDSAPGPTGEPST